MKAVLISIQPKWCELIASGKKTVEVRKTKPKLETPFKVYIYCTNTRPYLVWGDVFKGDWVTEFTHISGYNRKEAERIWGVFNGKVIGEFVCDKINEVGWINTPDHPLWRNSYNKDSCLTDNELFEYTKGGLFYEWHISDLVIYDKLKCLGDFNHCGVNYHFNPVVTKPPQSWCYVEKLGEG